MELTVLQDRFKFPLFHLSYDVMVSDSMQEIKELLEEIHPGITLDLDEDCTGYTCVISHPQHGSYMYVLINTAEVEGFPSITRRITHECTHLSWEIMDYVGVKVDADNHETQAYIMEELAEVITNMVNKFKNGIDSIGLL